MQSQNNSNDPIAQVMVILGYRYDPKYSSCLHAMAAGANPGIMSAVEDLKLYNAIFENFRAWALTIKELGSNLSREQLNDIYRAIIASIDKKTGSRWLPVGQS